MPLADCLARRSFDFGKDSSARSRFILVEGDSPDKIEPLTIILNCRPDANVNPDLHKAIREVTTGILSDCALRV